MRAPSSKGNDQSQARKERLKEELIFSTGFSAKPTALGEKRENGHAIQGRKRKHIWEKENKGISLTAAVGRL
jgi:hypothetical protein